MPVQFKFRAVTDTGRPREGIVAAQDIAQVEELLHTQNLFPIKIERATERRPIAFFGFLQGSDYERLIQFVSSLSTMYRAGIPLLRSLQIIREGKSDPHFTYIIDQIANSVQSGKSLSESLAEFPKMFSPVFIACVAAGEESGKLDATLDELSSMLEREMELTRNVKAAIRYPLIVMAVIGIAITVLMAFVIPRFMSFYAAFDAQLPLPTRILIGASNFITHYWWLAILLLGGAGYGIYRVMTNPVGRNWVDEKLLKLPIIGQLLIKGNVARFSLMLRIMYKSGLPLMKSLEILIGTVKNSAMAAEIQQLTGMFQRGQTINENTTGFRYFPQQALHMIAIGLESGNLEHMLGQVGDHYTKQVLYTSRNLTAIIEPLLTLVIGGFVLLMALAIFLPMWNLIKVFNH
jgi:type II secretory pathway component PulF